MGGDSTEGGNGIIVHGVALKVKWEVTSEALEFIIRARMNHRNSSAVERMFRTAPASTRGLFTARPSDKLMQRGLRTELNLTNEDGNGEKSKVRAVLNPEGTRGNDHKGNTGSFILLP